MYNKIFHTFYILLMGLYRFLVNPLLPPADSIKSYAPAHAHAHVDVLF